MPSSRGTVDVTMLGTLSLRMGDAAITAMDVTSRKSWHVLCYLILRRDRPVTKLELIDTFWPNENQKTPESALKMLVMRTRAMLKPMFGPDLPIVSKRGGYQWNPELPCRVDLEQFQELYRQAQAETDPAARGRLLGEAVGLVHGDLLAEFGEPPWLLPWSTRFHSQYVNAVLAAAGMLEAAGEFEQMEALCLRASALIRLDERLYTLTMRSMLRQRKYTDASRYYTKTKKILYNELGVAPSEELRSLQRQALTRFDAAAGELGSLLAAAQETAVHGAYACDYSVFQAVCQVELRQAARSGQCTHVALLTLYSQDGKSPGPRVLEPAMKALLADIVASLRQGDIVARSSENQYIIMLPGANLEDSRMVMDRVIAVLRRRLQIGLLRVSYELAPLSKPS